MKITSKKVESARSLLLEILRQYEGDISKSYKGSLQISGVLLAAIRDDLKERGK